MTAPREPDRLIRAVLEEGPNVLPDRVLDSVLGEVHRTRQRARFGPWRILPMSRSALAAAAVIAVVAIGGLAVWMNRSSGSSDVGAPSANPPGASAAAVAPTASLATSPAPVSTGSPAASLGLQTSGTIVFGRHDAATDTNHLFAIAPDGTGEVLLDPQDVCCVALTPDGGSVLYSVVRSDRLVPATRDLRGSPRSEFVAPAGLSLGVGAVSSGLDIAFDGWDDKDQRRTGVYLSQYNGVGHVWGDLKRLTTRPGTLHDIPLAFSPDGSHLLFLRSVNADQPKGDVFVIGVDGKGLRQLNPASVQVHAGDVFGAGASWSPDGSQITFSGFDTGTTDGSSRVYVAGAASGVAKPITETGIWTTSARWSPDGNWIAFDKDDGRGAHDMFVIHPDGTGLANLTGAVATGLCCAQWSADSKMLVAQSGQPDKNTVDLWIVQADGSGVTRLTKAPGAYKWYAWSSAPQRSP